jgi:hypothetical protein
MEKLRKSDSRNYYKIYRVNKNDTAVREISTNDFKPFSSRPAGTLSLGSGGLLFSLFTDIGQAMEKAKAGAQAYIEQLIDRGEEGLPELLQYRMDHYEDLNINLVEANIQKEENEMLNGENFVYKPYRIHLKPNDDDQK